MVRLREINAKAQFAFSPNSTQLVTATAAGSLSDDLSDESKIELYDPVSGDDEVTLQPLGSASIEK